MFLIISTAGSIGEAEKMGEFLIKKKLAACVNLVSGVKSLFFWQGKLCREREVILLIKTSRARLVEIIKEIKMIHSYSVPEIVALKVEGGNREYLHWVEETTRKRAKGQPKKNIDKQLTTR